MRPIKNEAVKWKDFDFHQKLRDEISQMLVFITSNDIQLDEEILQFVTNKNLEAGDDFDVLFNTHQALCRKISPITPNTLKSSYSTNTTLFSITTLGLVSAVFILFSSIVEELFVDWYIFLDPLNIGAAATLGSAFYSLFTANYYLKEKLYDASYDGIYRIRFLLGIFAGIILGLFAPTLLSDFAETTAQIGQTTLALVGGFSAEAVLKILQRVSVTLVTLVNGDQKEQVEAEKKKLEVDAQIKVDKQRNAIVAELEDTVEKTLPLRAKGLKKELRQALSERKK